MNESEILALLQKHQEGILSDSDKDKLDAWYLHKSLNSDKQLTAYELEDSY